MSILIPQKKLILPRRGLAVPSKFKQKGFIINPFAFGGGAGGSISITFNPADAGANIVFGEVNKLITKAASGNGWTSTRGTVSKAADIWYFTLEVVEGSSVGVMVGIGNSSASLATFPGGDANGWAYYGNGNKYTGGSSVGYGATYTTGDRVGCLYDAVANDLTFYKNDVSQGVAFTGVSGTLFPIGSVFFSGSSSLRAIPRDTSIPEGDDWPS